MNEADANKLTNQEITAGRPRLKKSHTEIYLRHDGSSEWVIQDLQHPGDVKLPHLTPPDDTPKSFTTRISGSKARFFDGTGKLLFEKDIDMSPFNQLLEAIIQKDSMPNLVAFGITAGSSATSEVAQSRDANLVKYFQTDLTSGNIKEILFDTNLNNLVETVLRNTQNQVITRVGFDYYPMTDVDAPNTLRRVLQTVYGASQAGAPTVSQMITQLTNLTILP